MTNGIYVGEFGENRLSDIYSALMFFLRPFCGGYKLSKEFADESDVSGGFVLFNDEHREARSSLERRLAGENNGFLHNISIVYSPNSKNIRNKLGFEPEYAIGILTTTDLEPQSIIDGSFALGIARKLKIALNCKYGVVIMRNNDVENWSFITG